MVHMVVCLPGKVPEAARHAVRQLHLHHIDTTRSELQRVLLVREFDFFVDEGSGQRRLAGFRLATEIDLDLIDRCDSSA